MTSHPNAGPGAGPVEIATLAEDMRVVGHHVDYGGGSATIVYVDTDNNIGVNLRAAAASPADVLHQLQAAIAKAGTSHPAPHILAEAILKAAGVRR